MAYVYRGTVHDVTPVRDPSTPGPKPAPFDPSMCGSRKGYKQHRRHGQDACGPCKAANAERSSESRRTGPGPWNPDLCGTYPGHAQHYRHGTDPCQPCRDAKNAYSRAYAKNPDGSKRLPRAPFDASACGTYKGYARHVRRSLEVCAPCRRAYNAQNRAYKGRAA